MSYDDEREALVRQLEDEVEYRVRTAVALSKGGHDHNEQVWQGRASVRFLAAGFRRSEVPEPSAEPNQITLEDLSETSTSLEDLIGEARSEGVWCCENGCGSGACETCPCCSAGWCVSGVDGVPDDPEDRERWLEVAAEHNPVAAALHAAEAEPQGDAQVLETFLSKLAGDGAYTLDFTSASALHGHIVSLLKRDIAAARAAGGVR